MQCPYFSGGGGEYCNKAGATPSSAEHIRNYCVTESNWRSCPNFTGDSGCFLTTACVHFAGMSDDCKELAGMRNFRDNYLLSLPNGQAMYDEYYRCAPMIVEAIEQSKERSRYLCDILASVRQCVQFADGGNNEAALDVYTSMFNELKNQFVPFS